MDIITNMDANKAKKTKKATQIVSDLRRDLKELNSIRGFRCQADAPMDDAVEEIDLCHDEEPQIQCVDIESDTDTDECSIISLERPCSTETSAFSISTKTPDYDTFSKLPEPSAEQVGCLPELPPPTELSNFIEYRVNGILNGDAPHVLVREIHCEPMVFTPSTELHNFLQKYIPGDIIYKQRSLFYLCVQEYDESCPPQYQNTAYIAMLDSVRHFEPSCNRTKVYYCILLSYLQYLQNVGFKNVFLWACPPRPDEEYVFYQRPKSQRTPSQAMLSQWYILMMKTGVQMGVLKSYSTLYDWCPKTTKEFLSTFPYYPGDHWLEQMNETVKSLGKLECNERNEVLVAASKTTPSQSPYKGKTALIPIDKSNYVLKEMLTELKVYKNVFFCMTLKETLSPERIPELVIPNSFACSREKILNFLKEHKLSATNICVATWSTRLFLFRLRISWDNTCAVCWKTVTNKGIRCKMCDMNHCESCKQNHVHNSWMQLVPWLRKDSSPSSSNSPSNSTSIEETSALFSEYEFSKWNSIKAGYGKVSKEYDENFIRFIVHVKMCKDKRKCPVCKQAYESFFQPKAGPSMPSTAPRSPSSSPSYSADSAIDDYE